jgi:hypothetical protein
MADEAMGVAHFFGNLYLRSSACTIISLIILNGAGLGNFVVNSGLSPHGGCPGFAAIYS